MDQPKIIFTIAFAIMLGKAGSVIRMQRTQQSDIMIFLLTAGPTSWLNIFKGFNENSILPSGAGKYGEWFGLSLALPTGFFFA